MTHEDESPVRRGTEKAGEGLVLRPEAVVLGDDALIPASNLVDSLPDRFTHELSVDEPYRYDGVTDDQRPSGTLPAGTPVAIVSEGRDRCRVVDQRGLAVNVRGSSVRPRHSDTVGGS